MQKSFFRSLMTLSAVILTLPLFGAQNRDAHEGIRNPLIGAWQLSALEEQGADGKVHKADCIGMLVYTRDGHMSVQVMYRNPHAGNNAEAAQYAQGGYEASFGTYKIDERAHTFIYHVDGALVRALVGKDLTRVYELAGKQLTVKSPDPNEHWRATWEHD